MGQRGQVINKYKADFEYTSKFRDTYLTLLLGLYIAGPSLEGVNVERISTCCLYSGENIALLRPDTA